MAKNSAADSSNLQPKVAHDGGGPVFDWWMGSERDGKLGVSGPQSAPAHPWSDRPAGQDPKGLVGLHGFNAVKSSADL